MDNIELNALPGNPTNPTAEPTTELSTNFANSANSGNPGADFSTDTSNRPGHFAMRINLNTHDTSGLPTQQAVEGFVHLGPVSGGLGDAYRLVKESLGEGYQLVKESLGDGYRELRSSPFCWFLIILATATFIFYSWMIGQKWPLGQGSDSPDTEGP